MNLKVMLPEVTLIHLLLEAVIHRFSCDSKNNTLVLTLDTARQAALAVITCLRCSG